MKRTSWLWVLGLVAAGVCTSSCGARLRSVPVRPEKAAVPQMVRQSAAGQKEVPAAPGLAESAPVGQPPPVCEPADAMAGQEMLGRRLRFYEARLAGWQAVEGQVAALGLADRPAGWGRCLAEVGELHDQYEMASRQVAPDGQSQDSVALGRWVGELLDRDVGYLGSGCEAVLAMGTAALAGRPEAKAPAVGERSASLPAAPLPPEARRQFGLALLRAGQLEAAANVLAGEGGGESSPNDDMAGPRLTADLLLAVGRVAEARSHYEMLGRACSALPGVDRWVADQLELLRGADVQSAAFPGFLAVLRAYLVSDGQRVPDDLREGVARLEAQAPSSGLARQGRRLLEMAEEKGGVGLPERLAEVDRLVETREFARGLAILEGLATRDDLNPAQQAMVRDALLKVRKAKFLAEETQPPPEQEVAGQWENGVQLLESRKYDEAIAIFTALLETGDQAQAKEKLGEASDLAIKEIRGQASALFVQARQTASLERKKSLLMESWKLLRGAETRYPGATVAMLEKVRQNRGYLEDYIRQVDPALLDASRSSGVQDVEEARP